MFKLLEHPDIYSDAWLLDKGEYLQFISLWGRDTSIQHFLARLSISVEEGGLSAFTVHNDGDNTVRVANVNALTKMTGRVNQTVYGDLVHVWLYDKQIDHPDLVNRKGMLLYRQGEQTEEALDSKLWHLVKSVSHLPLLDDWRQAVLKMLEDVIEENHHGYGISAYQIDLSDTQQFELGVQQMLQSSLIGVA